MPKPGKKPNLKPNRPANKLQRIIMHYGWMADNVVARIRATWPQFMHKAWVSGATATALAAVVLGASFIRPDTVEYTFAKANNCVVNPLFLPNFVDSKSDNYDVVYAGVRKILGYPVFSAHTCLEIKEPFYPVKSQEVSLSYPLLPLASKKLELSTPDPARVQLGRPADMPIATSGALVFHLSEQDKTFDYILDANRKEVSCGKLDMALLCNLSNLELKQDTNYVFSLARYFNGRPGGQAFQQKLRTVEPVRIVKTSIEPGQKVQNKPKGLVLTVNKNLKSAGIVSLHKLDGDNKSKIDINTQIKGDEIIIEFDKPLERSVKFELSVRKAVAFDEAYQPNPYTLKFSTSGGPKVTGVNIGNYGVGTGQSFVITFDTTPKPNQNIASFINVSGGMKYSVSSNGKQIIISPNGTWPRCNKFSIELKDGIENKYGISGGSAWQLNSRTVCQTIYSIGSSVKGRAIYAHRFGNGSQTIMFIGGTHGNEASSVYILNSWIDYLESSYDAIPSNKTIVVVPNINPDGIVAGTRTNARNVDLNRNFPANNWKKDVIMPDGKLNKGGGGDTPLSEPETKAIAGYILAQNPKLVMNYHAVGSLVIGNRAGYANSVASSYASGVGYWLTDGGGVFEYDTTGAMTDWLRDKYGIPAVLIELSSYYGNEFWSHQTAMWRAAGS